MDATTAVALAQVLGLIARTATQNANGDITDEQAKAIYDAAADRVTQAYENFKKAGAD